MGDLKARLLPPRPKSEPRISDLPIKRPLFNGIDALSLKKRGQGVRSWIRIDTAGNSHVLEVDKAAIMRRCDLPARDLRLLDPLFVYPSTILGRESAIVVNLEQIRCIITADEVLLLNSLDHYVLQYVTELQRRLRTKNQVECAGFNWPSPGGQPVSDSYPGNREHPNSFNKNNLEVSHTLNQEVRHKVVNDGDMFSGSSSEYLPFEFRALEVALEAACTFLDTQVCMSLKRATSLNENKC
jgi:magnesium transporter